MSIIIKGGNSSSLASVDVNNNLQVNTPTDIDQAGYVSTASQIDSGSATGSKTMRESDISQDYRLRVALDKILWEDTFNHTVLNTYKYNGNTTTHTIALASGFLNLNSGSSTAAGNSRVQTFRTFTGFATYPLYIDIYAKFSAALQANNVIEFGLGYATAATAPTDGVFFRATGGQLNGVININGSEQQIVNIFTPSPNVVNHYLIVIGQNSVEFWVDDILRGSITTPNSFGSPSSSNALPLLLRNYNTTTVLTAVQFSVAQFAISQADMDTGKDWQTAMAGNGQLAISATDGQTVALLQNYANSAAPVSATLSNTAAGYTTLGGQWQFAAVGGAETDYSLFAWTNPAGTATIPAKTLVVTGIRIDTFVTGAAVATTPTLLQWGIGIGSTAVSLATSDSATAGTRAARRLPLGAQTLAVGTAVGGMANQPVQVDFTTPIIVEAGTIFQIILKMPIATATASSIIRGTALVNGYFE